MNAFAPVSISAADLAGGGPASVQNTQADTALKGAQQQLMAAQTTGINIENQGKQIDLGSRIGLMQANREAMAQLNAATQPQGQQSSPSGLPGPSMNPNAPTMSAAPNKPQPVQAPGSVYNGLTPNPTVGAMQQANGTGVDKTDPTAMQSHIEDSTYNSQGLPSTLSTAYLKTALSNALNNPNVDPQAANAQYTAGVKMQQEMAEKAADIYKKQQDGVISNQTAQQGLMDTHNDYAHQALVMGLDTAAGIAAAHAAGIDPTAPGGQTILKSMSDSSPKGQAEQKQNNDNLTTSANIRNVASEIHQRDVNNGVALRQVAVAEGKLGIEANTQGLDVQKQAIGSANTIDSANRLYDTVDTIQRLRALPETAIKIDGNSAYVLTQNLPKSLISEVVSRGGVMSGNGQQIKVDNLLHIVSANTAELKNLSLSQGGAAAAAGSDARLNTVSESVSGNGLDLMKSNTPAMADSLSAVKNFARTTSGISGNILNNQNGVLQQIPGSDGKPSGLFSPVKPLYTPKETTVIKTPDGQVVSIPKANLGVALQHGATE